MRQEGEEEEKEVRDFGLSVREQQSELLSNCLTADLRLITATMIVVKRHSVSFPLLSAPGPSCNDDGRTHGVCVRNWPEPTISHQPAINERNSQNGASSS
jgi:hypothetical protein